MRAYGDFEYFILTYMLNLSVPQAKLTWHVDDKFLRTQMICLSLGLFARFFISFKYHGAKQAEI